MVEILKTDTLRSCCWVSVVEDISASIAWISSSTFSHHSLKITINPILKFEVLNWCRQLNQSLSIYVEYKSWSFFTFFPFENSSWDPIQPRNKLIHPSESKTLMKFFLTAIWVGLQTELKSSAYRLQVLRGYDQSPSHGHRFISCLKSSRPGFHIDLVFRPRGYIYQRWRGGLWIRYSTNVELYLTQAISHQLQNIDE